MATVVICDQENIPEKKERKMPTTRSLSERVYDLFLRIFCGGDRAELEQQLAEAKKRERSHARSQRETYQSGKEAILRLQKELRLREQAASVFEKRVTELERQLAEANERSLTDPLTGLFNRRGASEQLIGMASTLWHSTGSTEQPINKRFPCSVVYIDLDNFKPVNDQFGHPAGDEALRMVAELLRKSFPRRGDIIARVGGDEFVVIMTGADIGVAKRRSDELLHRMAKSPGLTFGGLRVGASIGVSFMILSSPLRGEGGMKPEAVMSKLDAAVIAADSAMYSSKRDGKGKVTVQR
jgi:two-component system cell cycle response regulator